MNVHGVRRSTGSRWRAGAALLWQSAGHAGHHHFTLFLVFRRRASGGPDERHGRRRTMAVSSSPAMILLSVLAQALMNASFGIFFPKFTGLPSTKYSQHRCRRLDTVVAYVGAAASKSVILALVTLATATPVRSRVRVDHPLLMLAVPDRHRRRILPARLCDRHLGEEFRAIAGRSRCYGGDPTHLPRRRLLLGGRHWVSRWRTITLPQSRSSIWSRAIAGPSLASTTCPSGPSVAVMAAVILLPLRPPSSGFSGPAIGSSSNCRRQFRRSALLLVGAGSRPRRQVPRSKSQLMIFSSTDFT